MKKVPLLIALVLSLFCISSCKKIPVLPENMSKAIIGKNWKLTAYTENGVDKLTEVYAPCELDNIDIFKTGGDYITDEGPTKCNDEDEQIQRGYKWEIKGNKLFITYDSVDFEFFAELEILEISAKTLKYAARNPDGPEVWIYTFTAQ